MPRSRSHRRRRDYYDSESDRSRSRSSSPRSHSRRSRTRIHDSSSHTPSNLTPVHLVNTQSPQNNSQNMQYLPYTSPNSNQNVYQYLPVSNSGNSFNNSNQNSTSNQLSSSPITPLRNSFNSGVRKPKSTKLWNIFWQIVKTKLIKDNMSNSLSDALQNPNYGVFFQWYDDWIEENYRITDLVDLNNSIPPSRIGRVEEITPQQLNDFVTLPPYNVSLFTIRESGIAKRLSATPNYRPYIPNVSSTSYSPYKPMPNSAYNNSSLVRPNTSSSSSSCSASQLAETSQLSTLVLNLQNQLNTLTNSINTTNARIGNIENVTSTLSQPPLGNQYKVKRKYHTLHIDNNDKVSSKPKCYRFKIKNCYINHAMCKRMIESNGGENSNQEDPSITLRMLINDYKRFNTKLTRTELFSICRFHDIRSSRTVELLQDKEVRLTADRLQLMTLNALRTKILMTFFKLKSEKDRLMMTEIPEFFNNKDGTTYKMKSIERRPSL